MSDFQNGDAYYLPLHSWIYSFFSLQMVPTWAFHVAKSLLLRYCQGGKLWTLRVYLHICFLDFIYFFVSSQCYLWFTPGYNFRDQFFNSQGITWAAQDLIWASHMQGKHLTYYTIFWPLTFIVLLQLFFFFLLELLSDGGPAYSTS